jgi:hypothetical protein
MRGATWISAAAALLIATTCDRNPTEPPAGLPTALSVTSVPLGTEPPFAMPTIRASHDSVIVVYISGVSGCDDHYADAGRWQGTVVVTVTSAAAPDRGCPAVIAYATYRVVVSRLPAGQYPVVVVERGIDADGKHWPSHEVIRQVVQVP